MKRTNVWRVLLVCVCRSCPSRTATAPNSAEWLVFVDPSIKRGKAAEFYQRPMMRMLLNNSAKSVLDGSWEYFSPEVPLFPLPS